MYKVAICDDQIDCLKGVAKTLDIQFIKKDFNAKVTIATNDQNVIFEAIKNNEIDILILDIDFKNIGKDGITFAKDLRKINKNFYLIFLTAHFRYMHLSFVTKTFDFLIKPVNLSVIENLIDRLIEEFKVNNNEFLHLSKSLTIKINNIIYIEKSENKSDIYTKSGVYSYTITLDKLLNILPKNFVKCHRSYIINKDLISTINYATNFIIFENGLKCPINSHFKLEE